jgi:hypothetical protein
MGKYMEDGPPGRLTIIVVSIEGVSVVEPFTEEIIFSALWRRIKSWGINCTRNSRVCGTCCLHVTHTSWSDAHQTRATCSSSTIFPSGRPTRPS